MSILFLLILSEGIISFFLKSIIFNMDLLSVVFLFINSIAMIFVLSKKLIKTQETSEAAEKDLLYIIIIGYFLRVFLLLIDYFVLKIPPHSGGDSELFHGEAITISQNFDHINKALGGMYTKFLGLFYCLFGSQRIMAQYFNTILGILIITTVIDVLKELNVQKVTVKIACIVMVFFPQNIIFSAILLRETIVGICIALSIKYFIRWFKKSGGLNIILSIIFISCGSVLHSAIAPAFLGYVFIYCLYSHKYKRLTFSFQTIFLFGLFCVFSIIVYAKFSGIFLSKFGNVKSIDSLISSVDTNFGGSAYLSNISYKSVSDVVIFTPIKTIYFLFSPMPWNIRNIQDIITILLDSVAYYYFTSYVLKNGKRVADKNKTLFYALIGMFILDAITLGLGTFTAGTAIRHRNKLFALLVIIYSISFDGNLIHKNYHKKDVFEKVSQQICVK